MTGRLRVRILEVAATASLGLLLAVVGPYGTFAEPLTERLAYWVGVLLAGYALYWPACLYADRTARELDLPRSGAWVAAVLAASAPVTLIVWLASFKHTPRLWPTIDMYAGFYPSVLVIGAAMTAMLWLLETRAGAPARNAGNRTPASTPEAPAQAPRLLARLPARLGSEVLALEMEDHYVRVHTAAGNTLLLMRLRDAIAELDGVEGRQVHRSWWVARSAVTNVESEGRGLRLLLRNGLVVPVPRERAPELREAGWAPRS